MPRPATRKTYKLAKAQVKGELQGKLEYAARLAKSPKQLKAWLISRAETMIDGLDILEVAAMVGVTVLVKYAVDTSEELRGRFELARGVLTGGVQRIAENTDRPPQELWGDLWGYIVSQWEPAATLVSAFMAIGMSEEEAKKYEGLFPDWADWVICFSIAFIIVRHAGALIGLLSNTASSIVPLIKMFLPV